MVGGPKMKKKMLYFVFALLALASLLLSACVPQPTLEFSKFQVDEKDFLLVQVFDGQINPYKFAQVAIENSEEIPSSVEDQFTVISFNINGLQEDNMYKYSFQIKELDGEESCVLIYADEDRELVELLVPLEKFEGWILDSIK
jgi:hypothetical protein